jgi:hypothetical protein
MYYMSYIEVGIRRRWDFGAPVSYEFFVFWEQNARAIYLCGHHASRITHHASRITNHASRITHHVLG